LAISRGFSIEEEIRRYLRGYKVCFLVNLIYPSSLDSCGARYTKALENIKTLRKDRVAELAAEREVLKALDNDNKRAKTLRERIANLQDAIAAKDARREEAESQHAAIAAANRNLQKTADAFRQTYLRYEGLEKELVKLNERLANAKLSVKEIDCAFLPPCFLITSSNGSYDRF